MEKGPYMKNRVVLAGVIGSLFVFSFFVYQKNRSSSSGSLFTKGNSDQVSEGSGSKKSDSEKSINPSFSIKRELSPGKQWTVTVPEMEIQGKDQRNTNYRRAYGIIERTLSKEWVVSSVTPSDPLGSLAFLGVL
jgi:hypothetical protein